MACDHLDKRTFTNAMDAINGDYNDMVREFSGGFASAMISYYDAWQSKKGFDKINKFYRNVANVLDTASARIVKNYNTMKDGGEAYARSQDMDLYIESIFRQEFNVEERTFEEDREIIIDDTKISTAGENMRKSLERINSYIDNSKVQTENDQKFGYYSDSDNPRASIHTAYSQLDNGLRVATKDFTEDFQQILEADKAEREARKQASAVAKQAEAVDSNNFTDIF